MELGNLVFGNSRGDFPVPRGVGYEAMLDRLARALGVASAYSLPAYENGTFSVFPYYWGGCTCGWEAWDNGHERANALRHRPDCYQHEYRRLEERYDGSRRFYTELRGLYRRYGLPTEGNAWWHGCATICTCDYHDRLEAVYQEYAREFGHLGCKPECLLAKPNFHYKPTDYRLKWYKYPLRDAYANRVVTLQEFARMIDGCIASLSG